MELTNLIVNKKQLFYFVRPASYGLSLEEFQDGAIVYGQSLYPEMLLWSMSKFDELDYKPYNAFVSSDWYPDIGIII